MRDCSLPLESAHRSPAQGQWRARCLSSADHFLLAGAVHRARTERALDNAWSIGLVTYRELHELLGRLAARGRNGIRVMRTLLSERPEDHVPPDSGLEARVKRLALDVGVLLQSQRDVGGDQWIGRVDFAVESTSRVIEVLSRRYHGSLSDQRADRDRIEELRRAGFEVMTLWDTDVWNHPEMVRDRILAFSRGDLDLEVEISARERDSDPAYRFSRGHLDL